MSRRPKLFDFTPRKAKNKKGPNIEPDRSEILKTALTIFGLVLLFIASMMLYNKYIS